MNRLRLAAAMSGGAAALHVSASAGHVREWWVLAVLFAVAALLQLGWAVRVWRGPSPQWMLRAGVVLNLGLAVVWAVSRVTGLPGLEREAVGPRDVQCTVDELLVVALVVSTLVAWRSVVAFAFEALALAAVCVSFVVLTADVGHAG